MGGGSNSAQNAAAQMEAQRQAQIRATTRRINEAFSDPRREAAIQDFLGARRQLYELDLTKEKATADRNLKFAMAKSGQVGGSLNRDFGYDLGEAFQKGLIDVERNAQADAASLRDADQQARLTLTSMAQSGLDATTAQQNADSALRNNLLASRSQIQANTLGGLFSGFSDLYKRAKEDAEYRRGLQQTYTPMYMPGTWGAPNTAVGPR